LLDYAGTEIRPKQMLIFFVSLYILTTLGIGFWASKKIKTSSDFMLAGKNLTTPFVGVTLFATWFGSNHIMGNPDYFVDHGFSSFFSLVITGGLSLVVVGAFYAKKLYRLNIVTVGDFFKLKYNKRIDTVISIILILAYPLWIASQLVALAILFQEVMAISFTGGLLLGASIVVLYTYIGGMWAVSYTDMLQSILILLGLVILLLFVFNKVESVTALFADKPSSFFSLLPTNNLAGWSEYIAVILALFVGSIPGQEIYQRIFSAKSENAAKNGLYLAALLIVVVPVIPALIALAAANLHPELIYPGHQNILSNFVSNYTNLPIKILFYGALISAILSTASGALLAPATIIGENLIKARNPAINDKTLLLWTKISVLIIALVSVYFAFTNANIVALLVASLSLILVCIFAPFTFGLFWKKSTTFGAWCSILLGGGTFLFCSILRTKLDPTIYGTIASCTAMIIGSILTDKNYNTAPGTKLLS